VSTREFVIAWLWAFLFTQVVEVPIYVALMRRAAGRAAPPEGLVWQIALGLGASTMTHPIVWFVIPRIVPDPYWVMVIVAESFAVIAEGIYFYALRAFGLPRAMLFSLLANAASAGLGFLCRSAFGFP
jgi:hypothetical protein